MDKASRLDAPPQPETPLAARASSKDLAQAGSYASLPASGSNSGQDSKGADAEALAPQGAAAGGGALLARIRAQRQTASKEAAAAKPSEQLPVLFAYASQTGTAQEIARSLQAEAGQHGIDTSQVLSLDELQWDKTSAKDTPIIVLVVSSTGEGDAPDNATRFYGGMKRRGVSPDALDGLRFTCCGLGDSNYTRFMGIPRAFKSRFAELGAASFYCHLEADEVDGIEEQVEAWTEGLWEPLRAEADRLRNSSQQAANQQHAASEGQKLDAVAGNAAAAQGEGTASRPPHLTTGAEQTKASSKGDPALPSPDKQQPAGTQPVANGSVQDAAGATLSNGSSVRGGKPADTAAAVQPSSSAVPIGKQAAPTAAVRQTEPQQNGVHAAQAQGSGAAKPQQVGLRAAQTNGTPATMQQPKPAQGGADAAQANGKPAAVQRPASSGSSWLDSVQVPKGDLKGVPALVPCRVQLHWLEEPAAEQIRSLEQATPSQQQLRHRDPAGGYSPDAPFWARVAAARRMTAAASDREVLHLELDIAGSGITYQPGDAIGLLPRNSPALTEALLQRLRLPGDRVLAVAPAGGGGGSVGSSKLLPHLRWPCTVRRALEASCDLTSTPRKSLLRMLAAHCSAEAEQRRLLCLVSREGRAAYSSFLVAQPGLLDVLQQHPSCQPPLEALLDAVQPLAPRLYSLSCSAACHPDQVHVAFTVVRSTTPCGAREGVATSWLHRLLQPVLSGKASAEGLNVRLPIYLKSGGDFRPPQDATAPLLMVGPGTGVAPFRGFLQHLQHELQQRGSKQQGKRMLYFGCRQADEDYLYRDDLKLFEADGTLSKLRVAFSRAGSQKVYVQHLLREDGAAVCALLREPRAHVFICGDGAHMARDVQNALAAVLQEHAGMSIGEAAAHLAGMVKSKRYVRDIWS